MRRIATASRGFHDDRRGLAAVEFALIVPLMLLIVFGTIEITNGVAVNRKVDLVSRTLSDLTSRATNVSSTDISSFFTVGGAIMQPYPSSSLSSTISEVYINPTTSVGRVQWSQGSSARSVGSTLAVPAGLIIKDSSGNTIPNQYLIYSEVSYFYVPAVGYVMNRAGITLSNSTFTRPRQLNCVYYPASGTTCPTS